MVKINHSHTSLGLQAVNTLTKAVTKNSAVLVKVGTAKVNPHKLLKASTGLKKNASQLDKIKNNRFYGAPNSASLLSKVTENIDDYQLGKSNAQEQDSLQGDGNQTWHSSFRLAEEISKLYPPVPGKNLTNVDRLVVFGDSLSDSQGRMYDKSLSILPSYSQYYEGRFTNGFVWGEYLSSPAFLNKELVNYAEGGSTSANYSIFNLRADFLSNLDTQIHDHKPSNKDLTILFLGSNDYIVLHKNNIIKVIEEQIDDIEKMLNKGADKLLVMGIPDLSLTPQSNESDEKRELKDISLAHNTLLQKNIEELQNKYPDKKIFYFDTSSAFKNILTVAEDIGYNTTQSYANHGYIHIPTAHDPALNIAPSYLFNDGVHPTQEVHHAFATILTHFIATRYSDPALEA